MVVHVGKGVIGCFYQKIILRLDTIGQDKRKKAKDKNSIASDVTCRYKAVLSMNPYNVSSVDA